MSQFILGGVTISRAAIDVSSGSNTLVPAVTGKKIKVLSCLLIASGITNACFRSGSASGYRLTGELTLDAGGAGFVLPHPTADGLHPLETEVGNALVLTLAPQTYVGGYLVYYLEE
jgi:hypothetical protein